MEVADLGIGETQAGERKQAAEPVERPHPIEGVQTCKDKGRADQDMTSTTSEERRRKLGPRTQHQFLNNSYNLHVIC